VGAVCASLLAVGAGCASKSIPRVPSAPVLKPAHPEPDRVPSTVRHRVVRGETLYRIARSHGISVESLAAANGIDDPAALAVGTELVVPVAAEATEIVPDAPIAAGARPDRLPLRAQKADASTGSGATAQPVRSSTLSPASGSLDWPLHGVLYARFGKKGRERHDGIDLAAPLGTPVHTAKAGRILYAGEQNGYGLVAIVDHGEGLLTLYAHNRDLRVKTGQRVRERQVIATVGESGRTSGPHLHFEVRAQGMPVDPLSYLAPPPDRHAFGRRTSDPR
jgi:lipoprotein NlpD